MLVRERMTRNPVLCSSDLSVNDAFDLMKKERIRRMPVVDKAGKLVGIVSDKDLLRVTPSPATTLSTYEIPYLLSKVKVGDVMTKKVITVTEDTPIEDAARIMVDNKIGGLPVVSQESVVVGIITETDIFKTFLELIGARRAGVRITMYVKDVRGELARVAEAVAGVGGNIIASVEVPGTDSTNYEVLLKVCDAPKEKLLEALKPIVVSIVDVREG
ncbi:MAG TPA: CBS domain-containing protein [Anaerolineae bacterium]|nr:CBS domain-containing protein [Anaerolineae bacterium]